MSDKTKVTIDRSKWRTGIDRGIATGQGRTGLLNDEGYQCCLGFICEAAGASRNELLISVMPCDLDKPVDGLSQQFDSGWHRGTLLSSDAVDINDGGPVPARHRVVRIASVFDVAVET